MQPGQITAGANSVSGCAVNITGGTEQKMSDEAHSNGPAYAFYGDDFTGATDTLAHLARAGLRTMLFFAVGR